MGRVKGRGKESQQKMPLAQAVRQGGAGNMPGGWQFWVPWRPHNESYSELDIGAISEQSLP